MIDATDDCGTERSLCVPIPNTRGLGGEEADLAYRPSWAEMGEIDTFDQFVHRFWSGKISPDEFRRFRLQNGIYGQLQEGEQMVRVKIPWGGLAAAQLEALAELAAGSPRGVGHVTTRQNMQFHFIKLERVTALMDRLASVGLTTREACGNMVRMKLVLMPFTELPQAWQTPDSYIDYNSEEAFSVQTGPGECAA